jgi:O-antigen/teichoic acid export membrane protein
MVDLRPASDRASFREGFGYAVVSFLAGAVIGVGSSIVVARLYGVDVVGQYALAIAPMGVVWFLSTARERPALIRALNPLAPRAARVTGLFAAVFAFSAALSLVVAILACGATYLLFTGPIDQPVLFVPSVVCLAGYVLVINTGWNLDAIFSAFRDGRQLFWIRLHQSVAFMLVAVLASAVGETVWSLVFALLTASATSLAHRVWAVRRWMRLAVPRAEIREGFRTLPEILKFGLKVTPGSLADGTSAEIGTWVLGAFGSVATVGAWSQAWTMGKRVLDLNYRLSEMLFPTLVERWNAGNRAGFQRALTDSTRYVVTGMLLPAAVLGGAAHQVMTLFGPGFAQASGALALLLLVPVLATALVFQTQSLLAVDRPALTSVLSGMRLVITVSASIGLTQAIGITGTAAAVVLGYVVQLTVQYGFVAGHLESSLYRYWPHRQLLAPAIAYGFAFATARALDSALDGPAALLAALTAGSAAYVVCLLLIGGLSSRDRELVGHLSARILRRGRHRSTAPPGGAGEVGQVKGI